MNRRLDENPPRRKRRAIWWWYTGGFLALLLAITPVVIAGVFNGNGSPETKTAPLKVPAPHPAAAPETEVYANNEVNDQEAPKSNRDHVTASNTPLDLLQESSTSKQKTKQKPAKKTADAEPQRLAKDNTPQVSVKLATPPTITANEDLDKVASLPIQNPPVEATVRDIPAAVNVLAQAELIELHVPKTDILPATTPGQKPRANALTLEAGALGTAELTGFYAGAGYRFRLSDRWSVPVAVRYRKEKLALSAFPISSRSRDLSSVTNTNPDSSFSGRNDSIIVTSVLNGEIAVDLSSGILTTEALETRVGLQYAVTPRLRVGTGVSLAYLWRGDLDFRARSIEETANSDTGLDLLSGRFNSSNYSTNGESFDVTAGQLPNISPVHLQTYLNLSYNLTPRLGLTAGGSWLLQQPDRNEISRVPAGRASLGLSWRLR